MGVGAIFIGFCGFHLDCETSDVGVVREKSFQWLCCCAVEKGGVKKRVYFFVKEKSVCNFLYLYLVFCTDGYNFNMRFYQLLTRSCN